MENTGNSAAEHMLSCEACGVKACKKKMEEQYPTFCPTKSLDPKLLEEVMEEYKDPLVAKIAYESAVLEGETYCKLTRVEETLEFIKRMNFQYIGIATCVGLLRETRIFSRILTARGIRHYVAGCKIGAEDKAVLGVPEEKKINGGCGHESMCNPVMQARLLNDAGTDFNVMIGLCVGHDALFLRYVNAPTTVLITKDKVLGHNPVQALYMADTGYSRFKKELGI